MKESYDRKSSSFYKAMAAAYVNEANSLENSPERFQGKAALVKALRIQAQYHLKMASYQPKVGVDRVWTTDSMTVN